MPCSGFHCCEVVTDKRVVLSEKKSKFTLNNLQQKQVGKIAFDRCAEYAGSGKRCDYVLVLKEADTKAALFIELKGNKLEHAIKQLEDSVRFFQMGRNYRVFAYVVATRSPMATTEIQNVKRRLRSRGIRFDVQCGQMTKCYEEHFSSH